MTWWFKARRGHLLLPLAVIVFGVGLYTVQTNTVLLPSLTGSPRIALSLFVPIPLLALLMASLESRLPAAEVSGVRSMTRLDNMLVTVVVAVAVLCSLLIAGAQGSAQATAGAATCCS